MSQYVTFDEFHLILHVPADLEDSACEVIRRILATRQFQTDLRHAVRQAFRQYPDLIPVLVRISV